MKNKKAFTLVELIVVLVILAIVALIVTPIVLSILKNAEKRARERSIDGYGKAIETAFFSYELNYGNTTTDLSKLDIKYSGDEVICNEVTIRENGEIYLSKCSVAGVMVKDSNTEDGYYHYGISNREYIKKYAIAMEEKIDEYVKENSKLPEDLTNLSNKYSKTVSCNQIQVNYNSSVYLSECNVGGIEEKDSNTEDGYYHYGYLQDYKTGDKLTYNGIEFYVIADSGMDQDYVTLLKAEPLTIDEVNEYGVGHINNYTYESVGVPYSYGNNYGGVAYYSSSICGYPTPGSKTVYKSCSLSDSDGYSGSEFSYSGTDVKYIVDSWTSDKIKFSNLKIIDGYASRLIKFDELYALGCSDAGCQDSKYKWTYSSGSALYNGRSSDSLYYEYWTMTKESKYEYTMITIGYGGYIYRYEYYDHRSSVRPVINLYKKAM